MMVVMMMQLASQFGGQRQADDDKDEDGDDDDGDADDDDDSHDGINCHHARSRSATRVLEPATNPPQCSVNRVSPPHTRLDREHATTWIRATLIRGHDWLPTYDGARG